METVAAHYQRNIDVVGLVVEERNYIGSLLDQSNHDLCNRPQRIDSSKTKNPTSNWKL